MEVAQVLHMVGGVGETSYASKSLLQKKALAKLKPMVERTLTDLYFSLLPNRLAVVDFGCSSGPNALLLPGEVMDVVGQISRRLGRVPPEIQCFFNDLLGNDFNTLFRHLAHFQDKLKEEKGEWTVPFYASGAPGSFYGRLFHKDSIHFALSSYSLHWLSQVPRALESETGAPLNKQNIYMSRISPLAVSKSYLQQFEKDFTLFLKLRSEEIITGGCMILALLGRGNPDPLSGECAQLYKLLADALIDMASEGLVEEEKVDSFNLPIYTPSIQELRAVIENEGSFDIMQSENFELNWDPSDDDLEDVVDNKLSSGENVAKSIRAVMESMFINQFGAAIIDGLFSRFAQNVATHLSKEKTKYVTLSISLKKRATPNM